MKFKALVFDLDGTAIPKRPDGMPSQAVIDAVAKAKKVCHVSIATGRPYSLCEDILDALDIDDLCIVNGGTHLYSRKTNEYVWKQEIDQLVLQELFFKLKEFRQYDVADEKRLDRVPIEEYRTDEAIALACIFSTTKQDAQKIISVVKGFKSVTAHAVSSWKDGTFDIHISHELATKKHALQSLLSRLNVDLDQIMVAGDGGNDLPLFELAGWKVAMGNGADELKEQADWIAPHVDDDGLAVAINKFILKKD
ncbi:MAG: HAD family hydrolase [Patescibacteria group bacterium]